MRWKLTSMLLLLACLAGPVRAHPLPEPLFVYNDWSAYDELSDRVPLTEELAMRELDELLRLRRAGVRFDGYMMDAFWFAPQGGYRSWRQSSWPNGPDRWLQRCRDNGLRPGLWFGTNGLVKLEPVAAWKSSLNQKGTAMSFFEGGFLADFMETLQYWYDHGVRMFKFDFVDFTAATAASEKSLPPEEIRRRNVTAFHQALKSFRERNPEAILVAYNGFGGDLESTSSPFPFHDPVDLGWLEVFDSMYSGDPRPSDVPQMNFWRSMDIYSDHMVRRFEQSGIPLERIDSIGFMVGKTGTIYNRQTHAWKGMAALCLARGGWINTVHGNLELLSDADAAWFARAQSLYLPLQTLGRTYSFGGIPGEQQPYGFASLSTDGAIYTLVNPSQSEQSIVLPLVSRDQPALGTGRILFRDQGYLPRLNPSDASRAEGLRSQMVQMQGGSAPRSGVCSLQMSTVGVLPTPQLGHMGTQDEARGASDGLKGAGLQLGAGQLAVVGFGRYASASYDLGVQEDVHIPQSIRPLKAEFKPTAPKTIETSLVPQGRVRVVLRQRDPQGHIRRTWAGGPPEGTPMGRVLSIRASQNGQPVPVEVDYDRVIWSGLSWGVGEIQPVPGQPLTITCSSTEKDPVTLEASLYQVEYAR